MNSSPNNLKQRRRTNSAIALFVVGSISFLVDLCYIEGYGWRWLAHWDHLLTQALFLLTWWLYPINEYVLKIRPSASELCLRGLFLVTSVGLAVTSCCSVLFLTGAVVGLGWPILLLLWVPVEAIPVFATYILVRQQQALYRQLPEVEKRKQPTLTALTAAALTLAAFTFFWLLYSYRR